VSFDTFCPRIAANRFVKTRPFPTQAAALGMHQIGKDGEIFELLFGGAAGGGKSELLLMAAVQYIDEPNYSAVLVRRTYAALMKAGALLDRAHSWWGKADGVHWNGTDKVFTFPGGGKIGFGYHSNPRDDQQFQGAEYQFAGFDELTQWPDLRAYEWIKSRVRRTAGSTTPLRVLSTSNPGGPGHPTVKSKFIGGVDPVTGESKDADPGCYYLPSKVRDNPYLDVEAYVRSLSGMHPTYVAQLLNGDWDARDPGDYFRADWFGDLLDPALDLWPDSECIRVRWWDLAASEKEDACWTSGARMARHRKGCRAIEHVKSFKATPGKRDDLIVQTAQADGKNVVVGIEIEGGSGGLAQFQALEKRLKALGIRVAGARPTPASPSGPRSLDWVQRAPSAQSAKERRMGAIASCLERGWQRRGQGDNTGGPWWGLDLGKALEDQEDGIRLFAGSWTQPFLDKVEGFPDTGLDEADAVAGAWLYLEQHTLGKRSPPGSRRRVRGKAELAEVHPSDRDKMLERKVRERWRP